jgi:hypothetical protein
MVAKVIEKMDGAVLVRYEAETNVEAMIMAQVSMEKADNATLSLHAHKPVSNVMFGCISLPVIETLREVK